MVPTKTLVRFFSLVLVVQLSMGCTTDSDQGQMQDTVAPDTAPLADGYIPDTSEPAGWRVLVPAPASYYGRIQQVERLTVVVVSGYGVKEQGVRVDFAIEGDNPGQASLEAAAAESDAEGMAQVNFRTGAAPASYTVRASAENAESVTLTVDVADSPTGSLKVHLQYDLEEELPVSAPSGSIQVLLFEGIHHCNQLNVTNLPASPLAEGVATSLSDSTTWKGLATEAAFTVYAVANKQFNYKDEDGSDQQVTMKVAAGCVDGIRVYEGEITEITVSLILQYLDLQGLYDMVAFFNLSGAIPGDTDDLTSAAGIFHLIEFFFTNPAGFFFDEIVKRAIEMWVGSLIESVFDAVFSLFQDELENWLNQYIIGDEAPDWLKQFFTTGTQITELVTNLEVRYRLHITKGSHGVVVTGFEEWHAIVIKWNEVCNLLGLDGCNDVLLDIDSLYEYFGEGSPEFPIFSGKFVGSVSGFSTLLIERHSIEFHYGKLILFFVEKVILPSVAGEDVDSFSDLFSLIINCEAVGESLSFVGIGEDEIESVCNAGLAAVAGFLTSWLDQLALDSRIRVDGKATIIDTNGDMSVDKIVEGEYRGNMEWGNQTGNEFKATFHGHLSQTQP